MQDKLLIATRVKKTIEYIEKAIVNYPHTENVLKNKIISSCYELLELIYKSNIHKDVFYMKEAIAKIRMLEYYIKISLERKLLSFKKYENMGKYLLEINKMIMSWAENEKNKQSI